MDQDLKVNLTKCIASIASGTNNEYERVDRANADVGQLLGNLSSVSHLVKQEQTADNVKRCKEICHAAIAYADKMLADPEIQNLDWFKQIKGNIEEARDICHFFSGNISGVQPRP